MEILLLAAVEAGRGPKPNHLIKNIWGRKGRKSVTNTNSGLDLPHNV